MARVTEMRRKRWIAMGVISVGMAAVALGLPAHAKTLFLIWVFVMVGTWFQQEREILRVKKGEPKP